MNLFQKLVEIRKSIQYLKKENSGGQYNFVSSSQVLGAIRKEMDNQGILVIPTVKSHKFTSSSELGGKQHMTEISLTYTILDIQSEDGKTNTLTIDWYGQGVDTGEKGVGKALTYAEKYLFLKLFQIPTDQDDPDFFQEKVKRAENDNKAMVKKGKGETMMSDEQRNQLIGFAKELNVPAARFAELHNLNKATTFKEAEAKIKEVGDFIKGKD